MEHLGPEAQRLGERRRAVGHDHELLGVEGIVGVRAAVDDVHERHRQGPRGRAADVAVEGQAAGFRRGLRHRQGDAQDRVGAQAALVPAPVEVDHEEIDERLVEGVLPDDLAGQRVVHGRDRLAHAATEVTLLVAVAQLHRLALAGGGAGGHRRPSDGPALERHLHLDGGVAPAVQDLPGEDGFDPRHA
jgi:hypothetical protein